MVYIQRSDGAYLSFSGMAFDAIVGMLATQSLTCVQISQDQFNASRTR